MRSPRWALVLGPLAVLTSVASVASVAAVTDVAASGTETGCTVQRDDPVAPVVAIVDSGLSDHAGLDAAVDPRSRSLRDGVVAGTDPSGHGTAMAAIVHRSAPSARLLVLATLDERARATPTDIAEGVRRATEADADVINLSVAGIADDDQVARAVEAAADGGAVLVISAGNDGRDLDGHPGWARLSAIPGVLVVSAADEEGRIAPSSDWGEEVVDVAAPGVDVATLSTDGDPTTVTGTSPAAARVSGALADALARGTPSGTCAAIDAVLTRARSAEGPAHRTLDVLVP